MLEFKKGLVRYCFFFFFFLSVYCTEALNSLYLFPYWHSQLVKKMRASPIVLFVSCLLFIFCFCPLHLPVKQLAPLLYVSQYEDQDVAMETPYMAFYLI